MDVSERFCDRERIFFFGNKRGVLGVLCKNILLADWLGSQHLLEIVQTSFAFKNSEKVIKSGCVENLLRWSAPIFFEMKEAYTVSCLKILIFR